MAPTSARKRLVVVVVGTQPVPTSLTEATEGGRIAWILHVRHIQAAVAPRQPRVSELVVDDGQRLVPKVGIDVVSPHRPGLVQVLVGIDQGSHGSPPSPVWRSEPGSTGCGPRSSELRCKRRRGARPDMAAVRYNQLRPRAHRGSGIRDRRQADGWSAGGRRVPLRLATLRAALSRRARAPPRKSGAPSRTWISTRSTHLAARHPSAITISP